MDTDDSEMSNLLHLLLNYLQIGHPVIVTEVSKSSPLSFLKIYQTVLEILGILVVLLLSCERNLRHFHLVTLRWSLHPTQSMMTSISRLSMLYSFKTRQRPSCQTRLNAFLKSMNLWKSSFWCTIYFSSNTFRLNICVVLLLRNPKPDWSFSKICSAWMTSLLRITRNMTLLGSG